MDMQQGEGLAKKTGSASSIVSQSGSASNMSAQTRVERGATLMRSKPKAKLGPPAPEGTEPTRALDDVHKDETGEAEKSDVDEHELAPGLFGRRVYAIACRRGPLEFAKAQQHLRRSCHVGLDKKSRKLVRRAKHDMEVGGNAGAKGGWSALLSQGVRVGARKHGECGEGE